MMIDGTGFNVEHWTRFNSEDEFVAAALKDGIYLGEANRELKLKVAYELICIQRQAKGVRHIGGDASGHSGNQ